MPSFQGFALREITPQRITEHMLRRSRAGASNGTINRELAVLRRLFVLAQRQELITYQPYVPHLREAAPRLGFVEPHDLKRLLDVLLDPVLRNVVEFLYLSGWRKNEVLRLDWACVNLSSHVIYLRPQHSKNRETRTLPLDGRLEAIVLERYAKRSGSWVFHRRGNRITDFRKAWHKATELAQMPGLLVHDLRRSAVRNLVRAGVAEGIAMKITGHKTRNVFERYNIISEADLRAAISKVT